MSRARISTLPQPSLPSRGAWIEIGDFLLQPAGSAGFAISPINRKFVIPLIRQFWSAAKLNETTVCKSFSDQYVLHYFVFILRIHSDSMDML